MAFITLLLNFEIKDGVSRKFIKAEYFVPEGNLAETITGNEQVSGIRSRPYLLMLSSVNTIHQRILLTTIKFCRIMKMCSIIGWEDERKDIQNTHEKNG